MGAGETKITATFCWMIVNRLYLLKTTIRHCVAHILQNMTDMRYKVAGI